MNFKEKLELKVLEIEAVIKEYLPSEEGRQVTVLEAMNYSMLSGGKRIRPMLLLEAYRLFGGNGDVVKPFLAAQEMIHTYSLVHDDLPAMDNDEFRRGRKTTHVVYGEAMAILAGDALLNYAFETAAKAFMICPGDKKVERAFSVLTSKAGIFGMIGGQVADIEAESREESLTKEELLFIHKNKTAALIQSALMIGAILAGADESQVLDMETVGYNIGIAFQIQDDILDVSGCEEKLGKPIGSDEKNNKETYVTLFGLDKAKEDSERLSKEAIDILNKYNKKYSDTDEFLSELVRYLVTRDY